MNYQVWIGTWSQGYLVHKRHILASGGRNELGKKSKTKPGVLNNFCFLFYFLWRTWDLTLYKIEFFCIFREVKLLLSLKDVRSIAQLICYDVIHSQEGVLLIVVMEKGELNLSKYIEKSKTLTISSFLFVWEGILDCISALHNR